MKLVCLLTVTLSCALQSLAVLYTDLEALGASCPNRDSCQQIGDRNFTQRNCECDRLCSAFQDCCIDAPAPTLARRFRNPRLHCMPYGGAGVMGAYVVEDCPRSFVGPLSVKNKCQGLDDFSDPFVSVPATDTSGGVTFRNRYCAECNNANPASLESWLIFLSCDTLAPFGLNDTYVWSSLTYRSDLHLWGVRYNGEFHLCEMLFDKPAYISAGVRNCRPDLVTVCPTTWTRATIKRDCESYTAVVYDGEAAYRNAHCALCNGLMLSEVFCEREGIEQRKRQKQFSFALLLDVNRSDGDMVGMSQRCPSGQKYDPFFKKCRALVCALPGYRMVNGRCKKE